MAATDRRRGAGAALAVALLAGLAGGPARAGDVDVGIRANLPDLVIGTAERQVIGGYYGRNLQLYEQGRYPGYEFDDDNGNAGGGGKGKGHGKGGKGTPPGLAKKGGIPPGLARKGGLPPGVAMNLARGHPLPPGLGDRPLPGDLMGRLAPLPGGYGYRIVNDRVLLIQSATSMIIDALLVPALR